MVSRPRMSAFLFTFVCSFILSLISWFLFPLIGKTITLLLFINIIAINALFGGIRYGFFATFFATLSYLFFPSLTNKPIDLTNPLLVYELGIFMCTGALISWVIEKYKKTDLSVDYQMKLTEFRKKMVTLRLENQKIQKDIASRDEFLAIASHELKTPLTSMLLKLQSMLHSIRNVSLAQFSVSKMLAMLETAEHQSQRLSRMINDLLNVSLITTGKLQLEKTTTDFTDLVQEVVQEFSEKFENVGTSVEFIASEKIKGSFDKVRIAQVMTNLLSNAAKYGRKKPVKVTVTKSGDWVKISIEDRGVGIPKDQKNKIFALFERGAATSHIKGLGVGLYIASQIVKAHLGKIKVESKEGVGSTFIVELPLHPII